MLEAMVSRVRCVTKLLQIVILFRVCSMSVLKHITLRIGLPSGSISRKADGSRSTILLDDRFTAPEQLGPAV